MCISIKKDKKKLLFNFKREKHHRQSKTMLPNKFFSVEKFLRKECFWQDHLKKKKKDLGGSKTSLIF